jgi:hypothetical protein
MKTYTYNSVLPREVGEKITHSVFGKCEVVACREGGLFGFVMLLRKCN